MGERIRRTKCRGEINSESSKRSFVAIGIVKAANFEVHPTNEKDFHVFHQMAWLGSAFCYFSRAFLLLLLLLLPLLSLILLFLCVCRAAIWGPLFESVSTHFVHRSLFIQNITIGKQVS